VPRSALHSARPIGCLAALLFAGRVTTITAQRPDGRTMARMTAASAAYVVSALFGARQSIKDTLTAAPFGHPSGHDARGDFLRTGTALSPGVPMLATQIFVTGLADQPGALGRDGARLLALHGALYFAGQLVEPVTYRTMSNLGSAPRARVVQIVANIAIPALLVAESVRASRLY
jgi:hypothetical protein